MGVSTQEEKGYIAIGSKEKGDIEAMESLLVTAVLPPPKPNTCPQVVFDQEDDEVTVTVVNVHSVNFPMFHDVVTGEALSIEQIVLRIYLDYEPLGREYMTIKPHDGVSSIAGYVFLHQGILDYQYHRKASEPDVSALVVNTYPGMMATIPAIEEGKTFLPPPTSPLFYIKRGIKSVGPSRRSCLPAKKTRFVFAMGLFILMFLLIIFLVTRINGRTIVQPCPYPQSHSHH